MTTIESSLACSTNVLFNMRFPGGITTQCITALTPTKPLSTWQAFVGGPRVYAQRRLSSAASTDVYQSGRATPGLNLQD